MIGLIDVPGHDDDQDAYTGELAGLYRIITAINVLIKIVKISGTIEVGFDGVSALNIALWTGMEVFI